MRREGDAQNTYLVGWMVLSAMEKNKARSKDECLDYNGGDNLK